MPKLSTTRLTKRTIDHMPPNSQLWDSEIRGFGVRRQNHSKSFVLKCTVARAQRFITIGQYGSPWTLEQARTKALELLSRAKTGIDPRRQPDPAHTVKDLCQRYLVEHAPNKKPRSSHSDARLIANHIIPLMGRLRIADVNRTDIEKIRDAIRSGKTAPADRRAVQLAQRGGQAIKGGMGVANRSLTLLSKMFNLAEEWDYRPQNTNPVRRVKRFQEFPRDRFLSREELRRLGIAISQASASGENPYALDAILLLLITGARLNEILSLKWDYIDWQHRLLRLPDSKTGPKIIHLSSSAIDLLSSITRQASNHYVIAGARLNKPMVNIQKCWSRIKTLASIDSVRLHDLRHTFASIAVTSGHSLPMVGRLLTHRSTQTTSRYVHLQSDDVSVAADQVAETMLGYLGKAKALT